MPDKGKGKASESNSTSSSTITNNSATGAPHPAPAAPVFPGRVLAAIAALNGPVAAAPTANDIIWWDSDEGPPNYVSPATAASGGTGAAGFLGFNVVVVDADETTISAWNAQARQLHEQLLQHEQQQSNSQS